MTPFSHNEAKYGASQWEGGVDNLTRENSKDILESHNIHKIFSKTSLGDSTYTQKFYVFNIASHKNLMSNWVFFALKFKISSQKIK